MRKLLLTMSLLLVGVAYSYAQVCDGSLTVTVLGSTSGEVLSATETHVDLSCNAASGSPDGSIDVTPAGGTSPYTFDWGDIAGTDDGEDRMGLAAGTYAVTVSDANGCTTEITGINLSEPGAVAVTGTPTNPGCNSSSGASNGAIDITPSGGTSAAGTYTYLWTTTDGSGLVAADQNQTGLGAGTYTVIVSDDNDCTATTTFTLTEPVAVSCTVTSPTVGSGGTNIACAGETGSLVAVGAGGTAPYQYSINGTDFQVSGTFSDLTAGDYTVTTKDANDCTSTCTITLTEPTPLMAGSCDYVQDLCQLGDGEIKIEASGGVAPYSVAWSATPVAPNTTAGTLAESSPQPIATDGGSVTFTGADGNNTYSFIVTDANGCEVP